MADEAEEKSIEDSKARGCRKMVPRLLKALVSAY
jgi:hypothetical protein